MDIFELLFYQSMSGLTTTQKVARVISNIGIPILIAMNFTWWLGCIVFILAFVLNELIDWLLIFYFSKTILDKTFIHYLKMLVVAGILIGLTYLILMYTS